MNNLQELINAVQPATYLFRIYIPCNKSRWVFSKTFATHICSSTKNENNKTTTKIGRTIQVLLLLSKSGPVQDQMFSLKVCRLFSASFQAVKLRFHRQSQLFQGRECHSGFPSKLSHFCIIKHFEKPMWTCQIYTVIGSAVLPCFFRHHLLIILTKLSNHQALNLQKEEVSEGLKHRSLHCW